MAEGQSLRRLRVTTKFPECVMEDVSLQPSLGQGRHRVAEPRRRKEEEGYN